MITFFLIIWDCQKKVEIETIHGFLNLLRSPWTIIAQTFAHHRYWYRSCLRLIIRFWGTKKILSKVKNNFLIPPKQIIRLKQYQMSRSLSYQIRGIFCDKYDFRNDFTPRSETIYIFPKQSFSSCQKKLDVSIFFFLPAGARAETKFGLGYTYRWSCPVPIGWATSCTS